MFCTVIASVNSSLGCIFNNHRAGPPDGMDVRRETNRLKMASPWFVAVKSSSASRWLLIVPVWGQKVKCVSPGAFKVLLRSREKEPTRPADRTVIAACFRHEIDTRLQKLQSFCWGDIRA